MILLALAKTERIRGHSSINIQRKAIIFIRLLPPTTLLPRGETLFHLPLINILEIFKDFSSTTRKFSKTFYQQSKNIQKLFSCRIVLATNHQNPKIFKDFFACRIVSAAHHQHSNIFKDVSTSSSNQQQRSTTGINSSNQQQQPATALSGSNQQQRPATAISSSNQQQQPTTAISSSNQQQQQSTAAINSSNLHQQSAFILPAALAQSTTTSVITTVPSCRYPASSSPRISCPVAECNHRTKLLHFCYFSTFLNFPFL